MNKFWVVLSHTYLSKLKTKSFITTTVIMLAIILLMSNISNIIGFFDNGKKDTIGVMDESGQYYESFSAQLKAMKSDLGIKKIDNEKEGLKKVDKGDLTGLLIIKQDAQGLPSGVYKSNTISDESINNELTQTLTTIKNMQVTQKLNISQEQVATLYAPAAFEKIAIEDSAKTTEELNQARGLVYVILFIIYFGVIVYAGMIASEVAGEKTSRVMEILISSISPVQQMFAKILGIALLSITQMVIFFGAGYFSMKKALADLPDDFSSYLGFGGASTSTIIYAIVFALLGYFLYATIAAFLGSLVSRVEDVQSMITPMTMLVVIAFMLAMFGLGNPEASFVKITSFIPPFTPMLMFLRVGMLDVPVWEVAVSIGLLIATIAVLAIFGAKVYRGGVLMYGKGSSFKNIKQAIALTKKD
ncbi:ABC transporter permease [Bacillus massiliigorillae]|uniref:ABC transporter permease n=1 Tax=Bacillus massiliigorillae TaxID=1243664 RepID=UPI0005A9A6E3|nr:ABC transporter permease [Bacillus massiliigorillae]